MADPIPAGGNGAKAFAGVIALVAVIAGVYAMVEPMGQKIEFVNRDVRDHARLDQHVGAAKELAGIGERFKEVETQFVAMRDKFDSEQLQVNRRLSLLEGWMFEHDRTVAATDATQWERIKALERQAYNGGN